MDITELLAFSAKQGASDLHLSAGLPPMIRVDGDVRRINLPAMEHKQVHQLIYEIMNDKQRKDFEEFLETDFSFEIPELARFRVNAFNHNRGAGAVFRTIPSTILTLEQLKDLFNPRGKSIRIDSINPESILRSAADELEKGLAWKSFADNDANVMGLAELVHGAGRSHGNLVCITLGTGVGGALGASRKPAACITAGASAT